MKKHVAFLMISIFTCKVDIAQNSPHIKTWNYPTIKQDTVVDYYFGKKIIDPFRNLENVEGDQVKIWMKEQNEFYDTIISNINYKDTLNNEIRAMREKQKKWSNYPKIASNRIFYPFGFMNDHGIERLGYIDSIHKKPTEIFNTKEINEKSNSIFTFNYYEPSFDGKYIAFGISPNGSENASLFIIDVDKKELLSEKIEQAKFGNVQWLPDNRGFFYLFNKKIVTNEDKKTPYEDSKVMFHILHTDPQNDREIFSRQLNLGLNLKKNDWPLFYTFPSSNKVILNVLNSSYGSYYYAELSDILDNPANTISWKRIFSEDDKIASNALRGDQFYGLSFKKNPDGQLIVMKLTDSIPKILYNASGFSLDDMVLTKRDIYITTLKDGSNRLLKLDLNNYAIKNIDLPYFGGLKLKPPFSVVSYYQPSENLIFTLSGYDKEWCTYVCNENNILSKIDIFPETQYLYPPIDLIEEEVEASSQDGTMVPLSIVYKKGTKLNGNNPTIIEAYGAYGISSKPTFKRNRLVWFKYGGIYAVAHVRGGGEKGDKWYKGGFKATKSNSWKDLIGCAEYLIKNKYTSSQKLATIGTSAGGITVGRAITERPDLFKASVIYVGDLNTLRLEKSFNTSAASEFGNIKDSIEFKYLYEMDVFHHIQVGVTYPSVLITASLQDARVAPWMPAKGAAKMQFANKGGNIVLFRASDKGHFNYPSDADVYAFLFWQLGHPDFKLKEKDCMFKTLQN